MSRTSSARTLDDRLHGIVTRVEVVVPNATSSGTGFFYHQLAERAEKEDPQWRAIEDAWLVTNRHVVLPRLGDQEVVPAAVRFFLRKQVETGLAWEAVELSREEFLARAKFHPLPGVDLCAIRVLDLLKARVREGGPYLQWLGVGEGDFAGENNIKVEVADDVLVIGFPRGFHDRTNLFPIVKGGIVATRWGAPFQGQPCFLVDAQLFPGSSGSIVISKPREFTVVDGKLLIAPSKQFAFLGVYSGRPFLTAEPIDLGDFIVTPRPGFGVGIVWEAAAVEDIVRKGTVYSAPADRKE